MKLKLVFVLFLAICAAAQGSETSELNYENMRHRIHLFFDTDTFSSMTPEELTEKTADYLSSRNIEFESAKPKNFETRNYMQAYVEVILGTPRTHDTVREASLDGKVLRNRSNKAFADFRKMQGVFAVQDS